MIVGRAIRYCTDIPPSILLSPSLSFSVSSPLLVLPEGSQPHSGSESILFLWLYTRTYLPTYLPAYLPTLASNSVVTEWHSHERRYFLYNTRENNTILWRSKDMVTRSASALDKKSNLRANARDVHSLDMCSVICIKLHGKFCKVIFPFSTKIDLKTVFIILLC